MKNDRSPPLVRHLALAIAVKLALLAGLWLAFFHDGPPPPDASRVGEHLAIGAPAPIPTPTPTP